MDLKEIIKTTLQEFLLNETFTNKTVKIGDILPESEIYSYIQKLHRNEEDFWEGNIGDRIESYTSYKAMEVSLDIISTDEYYLDDDSVEEYIEKYKKIGTYPPIVLGHFDTNWGYNIIDGTHRANALKQLGETVN